LDLRDDKVLTAVEREAFFQHDVWIEEKLDGANLGISFDREGRVFVQNRGTYLDLPATGQWKKLETWLDLRINVLFDVLSDRYILFGEWCYAQHSI
jgi:ATP-dependent RNA circularization protein (DNA/RNA ligase family)